MRRRVTHRTYGEVIGVRAARDHAALRPEPATSHLVLKRHLRPVGKDCLIAFDANLYSLPARKVRHRQLVEVRANASTITLHAATPDAEGSTLLATHPRARGRGERVVDETHRDDLPDGHTRAVTWGDSEEGGEVIALHSRRRLPTGPLQTLLKADRGGEHRGRPPSVVGL